VQAVLERFKESGQRLMQGLVRQYKCRWSRTTSGDNGDDWPTSEIDLEGCMTSASGDEGLFLFDGDFGRLNYRKNGIALFEIHSLD
jgi:hypothetical protein